jgi:hypothetical protein
MIHCYCANCDTELRVSDRSAAAPDMLEFALTGKYIVVLLTVLLIN